MNNLLSYCGLVEARISASEKDLPVRCQKLNIFVPPTYHLVRELPLKEEIPGNLKFNKDSLK